ncbi:hypothetical protein JCM6882_001845 [Rhodosporidiobolus microsporus]
MDDYAYQEDLAVYSFGQEDDLGALLADSDEALDALTFGLDDDGAGDADAFGDSVGKDFDFAGSTSRFLGTSDAQQAGLKPAAAASGWVGDDVASSSTPAARTLSPWTSLDDDPLLGRGGGGGLGALPPPVPVAQPPQQQQQQKAFKTLEEVEAEMRAQQQRAAPPVPAGAAKTLEEVEADLLRQRQQAQQQAIQASPAPQAAQVPQPQPQQPPQPQQFPPALPPGALAAFPPGFPPPLAAAYYALNIPPTYPPQMLPPHVRAQLAAMAPPPPPGAPGPFPGSPAQQPAQPPLQQQQQQQPFQQGHSRPGSLAGPQPQGGSPAPSPALMRQQLPPSQQGGFPQPPSGPPTPGPGFPPLGAPLVAGVGAKGGAPDLMATLFPPLPSQQQQGLQQPGMPMSMPMQGAPASVATVEQQLHYLSVNQHAQHPSLTGAQLQALLQQAHAQASSASGGGAEEGKVGEEGGEEKEEAERKRRAAEELVRKVEERIMEHERMEEGRKRKAAKIAAMAKHNNLMSNSDKDFITRIQVSQLVTDDPYADDFYFHIMAAIKASRGLPVPGMGPLAPPPPGPNGPPGGPQQNGGGNRRNRGRENAMNRMAQNVQRLVDSAKKRNANNVGAGSTLALDGALGKIATRTRSAPRPLLQVKPSSALSPAGASPAASSAAVPTVGEGSPDLSKGAQGQQQQGPSTGQSLLKGAGLITTSASSAGAAATATSTSTSSGVPLSYRATLSIVETLYDCVLDLEQLRRIQPQLHAAAGGLQQQLDGMTVEGEVREQLVARVEEAKRAVGEGEERVRELTERLWGEMRVMEPLDGCTPHPFVSILALTKGKRILPRAIRHLSPEQTLTLLTLIVATFDTLDVVVDSPKLDQLPTATATAANSTSTATQRKQVADKTEALLAALVPPVMAVVGQAPLRMVTGMLGLLMDRNDVNKVVRSKPGLAFLTILLSRAEGIKQAHLAAGDQAPDGADADLSQWHRTFTHLFAVLSTPSPSTSGYSAPLLALFPSTRLVASLPFGFLASSSSLSTASLGALNLRPEADGDDEPVWRFLAAVAVCADPEQQQQLVMGVRDKVVENVKGARAVEGGKVKGVGAEVAGAKLRNVNLLLHALSLDASMIETDDE